MVAEEASQKQQQYGMVQELLRQSNNLREELQNLRCLSKIKAEERGQKHRELLRAQVHFTHVHKGLVLISLIWLIFQLQPPLTCMLMCKWDPTSFMFRLFSIFILEFLYSAYSQSWKKKKATWLLNKGTFGSLSLCVHMNTRMQKWWYISSASIRSSWTITSNRSFLKKTWSSWTTTSWTSCYRAGVAIIPVLS